MTFVARAWKREIPVWGSALWPTCLVLLDRLADLIDIRKDDLGLALAAERQSHRGQIFCDHVMQAAG